MSVKKLTKNEVERYMDELIDTLSSIKNDKSMTKEFLRDLLTPKEYADLGVRWQIVKNLAKGAPQRAIAESFRVATATVTRGSRELLNKDGGFQKVIQKLNIK